MQRDKQGFRESGYRERDAEPRRKRWEESGWGDQRRSADRSDEAREDRSASDIGKGYGLRQNDSRHYHSDQTKKSYGDEPRYRGPGRSGYEEQRDYRGNAYDARRERFDQPRDRRPRDEEYFNRPSDESFGRDRTRDFQDRGGYRRDEEQGYRREERGGYRRDEGQGYRREDRDFYKSNPREGKGYDNRSQERAKASPSSKSGKGHRPPAPPNLDTSSLDEPIRLNKYVARSTQYTRREADDLVKRGRVTVNGEIVGPGTMIGPGDVVLLDDKPISRRDHLVYILINKPAHVLAEVNAAASDGSTSESEESEVRNLSDLLRFAGSEQLMPVLALEPDMLGLQLISNDDKLLGHFNKHLPKEVYHLSLAEAGDEDLPEQLLEKMPAVGNGPGLSDAEFLDDDLQKLSITLRGPFPAEALKEMGLEISKVDRLQLAGLTKKNLPRGHWRFLSEREVTWVTMFQQ